MKSRFSAINIIDLLVYFILFWFTILAKYKSTISLEAFGEIIREDGWVENLTAFFLAAGAAVMGYNAVKAAKQRDIKALIFFTLSTLVFFFGAGEEISWGQRIWGIQPGEYFLEHNYQGEMNLHNLEIDGVDLNKLIFSKLLFVALLGYFIILPLLTWKVKAIRQLVTDFKIPIPKLHHIIVLLAANSIVLWIGMKKQSELHELVLTGILFLVFLNPAKKIREVSLEPEDEN